MNNATDIELMLQVRHGSESALREVIERHRERLFRLASRLLGDYVIEEHADVPNYWAYALTLLLLLGGVALLAIRRR